MSKDLEIYEKKKIGRLIAWGGEHIVYDYDSDKVIKFSLIAFLFGDYGTRKIIKDYSICKQYFNRYVLETEFRISADGKRIAVLQSKITGHYLQKEDLSDSWIKEQFDEILKACQSLAKAGEPPIDLLGKGGTFRNCLSNIFVTPHKQLFIIDASLLALEHSGLLKPLLFVLFTLAKWKQGYVIKKFTSP